MKKNKQAGFTLVELAIVMIIIGLLIGGVLKGQELIKNAQVNAVISQTKAYTASTIAFIDAYGGMPGDMANATQRIRNCDAPNNCFSGNGDSIVGSTANDLRLINQAGVNSLPEVETSMYWKHLALANFITGVDPTANPTAPAWGESHPASKMTGGFHIFYSRNLGPGTLMGPGHKLRWQNEINTNIDATQTGIFVISPILGLQIDRKMDDGLYLTGVVTADFESTGCGVVIGTNIEYGTTSQKNCIMYFGID
jgi:prepilin-type N-terminal cleavage/methylation domain-containing protein